MARLKSTFEIEIMAEAGRRLARILRILHGEARPGITSKSLDIMSRKLIREAGGEPAFLGYRPLGSRRAFPAALCVSLNETVVHGTPSDYVIKGGDLVKLDLGLVYRGFYVDAALTVGVGAVSEEAVKLIDVTHKALSLGIAQARPGKTLGDIGWAIESFIKSRKFSVAKSLCGHGIGRELHEDPSVLNTGRPGRGEELLPGMVLAIEPMATAGSGKTMVMPDESFVTADGTLSAHFEHTVAVTSEGPQILTKE